MYHFRQHIAFPCEKPAACLLQVSSFCDRQLLRRIIDDLLVRLDAAGGERPCPEALPPLCLLKAWDGAAHGGGSCDGSTAPYCSSAAEHTPQQRCPRPETAAPAPLSRADVIPPAPISPGELSAEEAPPQPAELPIPAKTQTGEHPSPAQPLTDAEDDRSGMCPIDSTAAPPHSPPGLGYHSEDDSEDEIHTPTSADSPKSRHRRRGQRRGQTAATLPMPLRTPRSQPPA